MLEISAEQIRRLEQDLLNFRERAYPFATRFTLTNTAFRAREFAQRNIEDQMVLRRPFAQRSVQVERARTLNVEQQEARVGSTADFMETQEFGGRETGRRHGHPVPTPYSAGQGRRARPRTRVPRRRHRVGSITLGGKRVRPKTPGQRLVLLARSAIESGQRHVFWQQQHGFGPRTGIYYIAGGSLRRSRGWPRGAKMQLVHDMSHGSITIPRNPWLDPAVVDAQRMMPQIYRDALVFQLDRHGIFVDW